MLSNCLPKLPYINMLLQVIDPLLHDALEVMASAEGEFKIRCSLANRQKDTRRCKIKTQGDKCGSTVEFMKRVSRSRLLKDFLLNGRR